jgi:hypothetical protein
MKINPEVGSGEQQRVRRTQSRQHSPLALLWSPRSFCIFLVSKSTAVAELRWLSAERPMKGNGLINRSVSASLLRREQLSLSVLCLPHCLCVYLVILYFLILSKSFLGSPVSKCLRTGSKMRLSASATAAFRSPGWILPDL